jgi:uncharacterized membrane protein YhaH (DUF805 family)
MTLLSFLFSPFGRISRSSWWTIQLINSAIMIAIASVVFSPIIADPGGAIEEVLSGRPTSPIMMNTAFLPTIWIALCATIKRYHDRNKSGLWSVLAFIPVIGPIWQLIELGSLSGTVGANAFGEQPSGFGATGAPTHKSSSADGMVWNQNVDDAIAEAARSLAAQDSAPIPKPSPTVPRTTARTTFGQRGVS